MNRCSCIYDIRGFPKLSQIEKQTLSWLEKEVWPKLHREAKFHGKVDTPIALLDGGDFRATQMVIVCGTHLLRERKEHFLLQ
jgi:hypothetical protein